VRARRGCLPWSVVSTPSGRITQDVNRLLDLLFSNRRPAWRRIAGTVICYAVVLFVAAAVASITGLAQWLMVTVVAFVLGVWLGVAQWRRTGRFPFGVAR
jgi:hypothetical protein